MVDTTTPRQPVGEAPMWANMFVAYRDAHEYDSIAP